MASLAAKAERKAGLAERIFCPPEPVAVDHDQVVGPFPTREDDDE